jgi:hypothetical protein
VCARAQATGLLGVLAGAFKYMSPWKARPGNPDDNVPVEDAEDLSDDAPEEQLMDHMIGADEQQGYGDHHGGGWGAHEPELHEFAKRLPNSVDRLQSSHDHLDESTEMSAADTSHERLQVQSAGVFAREGGGLSMADVGGGGGAGRDHLRSFGGNFAGSGSGLGGGDGFGVGAALGSGLGDREVAAERGGMLRPRGVRKELMMPLRVAQTVSRMGKENIQHKRALKLKFDAQDLKAYMVSCAYCELIHRAVTHPVPEVQGKDACGEVLPSSHSHVLLL